MNAHVKRIEAAFAFRPVPTLTLPEWADQFRFLAASTAATPGPWHTSRVEIARGPMLAVTEAGVRTITVKSCTQLMKTEVLLNTLGYLIHQAPAPVLVVLPKEASVRSFSKERLAAMVRVTPALRDILGEVMRDRSLESLAYKEFPGGFIAMESAGSPANLAARPIRVVLLDEIDKFEDLRTEGDPVLLAEERTSTFEHPLHIRCCSPTVAETSRIERSYIESDQRRPYVACPHCGHEQTLEFFKHVQWQKSEDGEHFPTTAAIYCESCGAEWSELQRLTIMTTEGAIKWRQTKPFTCCGVDQRPMESRAWDENGRALCTQCNRKAVSNTHAGFTASKLYSPSVTVATLAEKWIAAKDDLAARQVFYNTQLGQAFSAHAGRRVETHVLASRRERFPAPVPRGVLRLTAGVDVQGDRLEAQIVGWGFPLEAWSVHYAILPGDPSKADVWNRLDELFLQGFEYEEGQRFRLSAACIDSGGQYTEAVYRFCKARSARNIWAIKGSSWAKQGDPVWPPRRLRRTRESGSFKPTIIAVDSAKDQLRQMLLTEEHGPGFVHIPEDRPDAFLDQLTAEQCVFEKRAGATIRKWILPRGRANEAFDTLVYAYAALRGLEEERGLKLERATAQVAHALAVASQPVAAPAIERPASRMKRSRWMSQ